MNGTLVGNKEPLGYIYMRLRVGTPGQDFVVIVGTGSALLAVPCEGCKTTLARTPRPGAGQSLRQRLERNRTWCGIIGLGHGSIPALLEVLTTQGPSAPAPPTGGQVVAAQHGALLPDTMSF